MRKTILIIVGLLICSFLLFGCNGLNETCPDGEVSLNGTCTIEIDVSLSEENNQEVLALLENKVDLTNRALATNEDIRIAKQIISNLAFSEEETEVSIVITIENLRDTPIADMEIILVIPKELVESASMITSDDEFEIIEDDPIIKRKAKKIDPHKTGTWIARFLRPKKKTPVTKKEAKKTKEVVVWDQWDPDGDGIIDEDELTRGDTGESGPSGEPGELIRSINPDKRYNDDPLGFIKPGPVSCTTSTITSDCGNDCQWFCDSVKDNVCARNGKKYFFHPTDTTQKTCCWRDDSSMFTDGTLASTCCPSSKDVFYGNGEYTEGTNKATTACCEKGDTPAKQSGRPSACCELSKGKVLKYGMASGGLSPDYSEGSDTESSVCCGLTIDDRLTTDDPEIMREQNMAAFIALTDKWGAAVDCCDTDTHNHGFGRGTYSKQGICCQKPDVVKQRTIKDATLAEPIDYPYCGTKTSTLEIDPDLTPESPPQETSPNDASEEYS